MLRVLRVLAVRVLRVQEEGKFVHEWGILCAELVVARKFVHERGILCAELRNVLGKR